jgi:hypothetical protein
MFIEHGVPAGRRFAEKHDDLVDRLVAQGVPASLEDGRSRDAT